MDSGYSYSFLRLKYIPPHAHAQSGNTEIAVEMCNCNR